MLDAVLAIHLTYSCWATYETGLSLGAVYHTLHEGHLYLFHILLVPVSQPRDNDQCLHFCHYLLHIIVTVPLGSIYRGEFPQSSRMGITEFPCCSMLFILTKIWHQHLGQNHRWLLKTIHDNLSQWNSKCWFPSVTSFMPIVILLFTKIIPSLLLVKCDAMVMDNKLNVCKGRGQCQEFVNNQHYILLLQHERNYNGVMHAVTKCKKVTFQVIYLFGQNISWLKIQVKLPGNKIYRTFASPFYTGICVL
jgi:hypothetical protein